MSSGRYILNVVSHRTFFLMELMIEQVWYGQLTACPELSLRECTNLGAPTISPDGSFLLCMLQVPPNVSMTWSHCHDPLIVVLYK